MAKYHIARWVGDILEYSSLEFDTYDDAEAYLDGNFTEIIKEDRDL